MVQEPRCDNLWGSEIGHQLTQLDCLRGHLQSIWVDDQYSCELNRTQLASEIRCLGSTNITGSCKTVHSSKLVLKL